MRVFIIVLVLIFSFQSWTKADDIKDFEIEGMSIGDSLLDYFSEDEILKNIKWHYNDDNKNNKFVIVEFYNLETAEIYHGIQTAIKPEDKSYKIYLISGAMLYKNNVEDCYLKMKEIDEELSKLFKNADREEFSESINTSDKSGKSTYSGIYYYFNDGAYNTSRKANASVQCYDYSEEYKMVDNLRVGIRSSEYREWYFSSRK